MKHLGFTLGGRRFAIPAAQVAGVAAPVPLERVPGAPPEVAGARGFRGEVVAVLDAALLLEAPAPDPPREVDLRLASPHDHLALRVPLPLSPLAEGDLAGVERLDASSIAARWE